MDSTAPFPSVNKHLLITSVANEAGFAIYGAFPDPLPKSAFEPICRSAFLSNRRTEIVVDSPFYSFSTSGGVIDARTQLQELGTDYQWRCSAWTFARNWVRNGGTAYVGKYLVGATYPGNQEVPYCTQPGIVCHQDDIEIVVSTHVVLRNFPSINQFFLLVWDRAEPHDGSVFPDHCDSVSLQGIPDKWEPEHSQRSAKLDFSVNL